VVRKNVIAVKLPLANTHDAARPAPIGRRPSSAK
jgi:hypothetical protein